MTHPEKGSLQMPILSSKHVPKGSHFAGPPKVAVLWWISFHVITSETPVV